MPFFSRGTSKKTFTRFRQYDSAVLSQSTILSLTDNQPIISGIVFIQPVNRLLPFVFDIAKKRA